ncbi:glycoside hydrolase family 43 protein [Tamlana sp. I1]|uniref:glycoside hydrolase family 43 protein n=1 Tax=Tamlana sp. I1 TaxID=2762061 RepID=UPI001E446114|nr:glycoside hydrolase family 43 protein [Tamlana sp. I1]
MIKNPILKGFNPDPSIIRVGSDYYIATSTFEWFPGVQIHHSKDLVNWKLVARPLNRVSQLDMRGNPDSCGVWAPCLSYNDGVFYLVYSNVRSFDGICKDTPNYLVTTTDILGDWSEPIYLSSRGFDGSLFHEPKGKKWYLNMLVDHRKGKFFGGIEMQEYCPAQQMLVGDVYYLTEGSSLGLSEGPHIFFKDGFYYMIMAEGGTEYGHAMTIARSSSIYGPYEMHPNNPLVSSRNHPDNELQKAGHGDIFQTQHGDWYAVFLIGRPISKLGKCTLGRETAIEEVIWENQWPYLKQGGCVPRTYIPTPNLKLQPFKKEEDMIRFNILELPIDFQSLRIPVSEEWCSLQARPGYLRLYGKESLASQFQQSLIARRVQDFHVEVTTAIVFQSQNLQQMAGLVFYYNTDHSHYACITANYDGSENHLSIFSANNGESSSQEELIDVTGQEKIYLKGIMHLEDLQFYYSFDNRTYQKLGELLDASILSDDHVRDGSDRYRPAFTGSFVGMCCQDLAQNKNYADFEWFEYKALPLK